MDAVAQTSVDVLDDVATLVDDVRGALAARQHGDGHWVFELEADATIPAEYILLQHYLGEADPDEDRRIALYLRDAQGDDGGWPLFAGGELDLSATVKAYYALKLAGDDARAPHMRRAREAVLARGGAARTNVFTRISLALFGQAPWRAVPVMPPEIMLLPRWFPFHMEKVSYWSRTVIAPLLVLMAVKPRARNPSGVGVAELFTTPADEERRYITNATGEPLGVLFVGLDAMLRKAEPLMPAGSRKRAVDKAVRFITERLNGEDGLGGIFPAMANAVMAFDALGYAPDHPDMRTAKSAVRKLLTRRGDALYCQPCLSPLWDTALALHAMMEAGEETRGARAAAACAWLGAREITKVRGDWVSKRPALAPSGWAFQYWNDHYPDVDDTAVVVMALHRADPEGYAPMIERATRWIIGMQSENGGWGSFDADNTHDYLNHIPFADHGALLDPPTADVSARCLSMLGQLGYGPGHPAVRRGVAYLKGAQEEDGSWYGRWGVNYVYGTWSALCALAAVGEDMGQDCVRRAVAWLESRQREDGGWGEGCASYWDDRPDTTDTSTPSQTAWALLGLMAAGEVESETVRSGVRHLVATAPSHERWEEELYTGTGFPRVFYLKYHGYSAYFPLWALARYRNLVRSNDGRTQYGM